jgi:hypothetical protein
LAEAVAALAARLDAAGARDAAAPLVQAIPKEPDAYARRWLAEAVAALAARLDAAGARDAAAPLVQAIPKEPNARARAELAGAVAALASRLDAAEAAKVCAGAATPLVYAIPWERDANARSQLAQAVAALAPRMNNAAADSATWLTADALLDSLKGARPETVDVLSQAFGAIAEWASPRDIANLLTKHQLPPAAAAAVLRQLEPLACRHFETIDDAVRWFRAADPAPPKP